MMMRRVFTRAEGEQRYRDEVRNIIEYHDHEQVNNAGARQWRCAVQAVAARQTDE